MAGRTDRHDAQSVTLALVLFPVKRIYTGTSPGKIHANYEITSYAFKRIRNIANRFVLKPGMIDTTLHWNSTIYAAYFIKPL